MSSHPELKSAHLDGVGTGQARGRLQTRTQEKDLCASKAYLGIRNT